MPQYRATDILFELIDLGHERIDEVRCRLAYYRASVYKKETADLITTKLDHLQRISGLFGDELLSEAFTDYAAMAEESGQSCAPGECSFTRRVNLLLHALDAHLSRLYRALISHHLTAEEPDLTAAVRAHRQDLLALCSEGSRQWTFFQTF